jgi:anthranilate phosphoribosyltransferase
MNQTILYNRFFCTETETRNIMAISAQDALNKIISHQELTSEEMVSIMRQIMLGEMPPLQVAGILTALRVRGESVNEVTAAAKVMRSLSTKVNLPDPETLVDVVGTGGDAAHTFNISTTAMFVAGAAGARVAKHGSRGVSSKSGSADVLEAFGAQLQLTPEQVSLCVEQLNVGFMFAPNHHSAMRNVAPIRRELGIRTTFNILGPLTNPAGSLNFMMGVFEKRLVSLQAQALKALGAKRAMVVWGQDGLDEISLSAPTSVCELKNNELNEYEIQPKDFGFAWADSSLLRVESPQESKKVMELVLNGSRGAPRDIVLLNSAATLYVGGIVKDLHEGVHKAAQAIDSGAALQKLKDFVALTQSFGQ